MASDRAARGVHVRPRQCRRHPARLRHADLGDAAGRACRTAARHAGRDRLALAAGLHLPRHIGWRELLVVALATSTGFSIALFFATGVLATGPVLSAAKIGVIASALGVLLAFGAAWLLKVGRFAA